MLVHCRSAEATKSELDLFTAPPTQTAIEGGRNLYFKPTSAIHGSAPVEFVIPGSGDGYLDLAHTMLAVRVRITRANGADLAADDEVGPINNLLHSLWSEVVVLFNGNIVSSAANNYGYRAYMETLLSYGKDAKASHLTSALFYADTPGEFDSITNNQGLKKRMTFTAQSHPVDLYGPIFADVFNSERYLLNEVEVRVKLIRNKDSFCLMSANDNFKLEIQDATLVARQVLLNPSALIAIEKTLQTTPALYPLTRTELKCITISSQLRNKSLDSVFLGPLPKRLVIALTSNDAFNGSAALNPFKFDHFNLSHLSVFYDGVPVPSRPLEPNFETPGTSVFSYHTLFSGTGMHYQDEGNDIDRESYFKGSTVFVFDLTPDLSASDNCHWTVVKQGNLRIDLKFSQPLPTAINAIIYGEFQSIIQIDKARNILLDYPN